MESTEQAQGSTYFTSCCQPAGEPSPCCFLTPLHRNHKKCHTLKPALSHSLLTLTEVQPSPGRGKRLLPHLGSPGCSWVNPAPPPIPCELVRNISCCWAGAIPREEVCRQDCEPGPALSCPGAGLTIPVLLRCNPEFQKGMQKPFLRGREVIGKSPWVTCSAL